MQLSLDGIRVIDLSRVLAGPFCCALLGDMGADVIKVEDTASGDESRTWPPHKDGESAGFIVNNRNKRGIAVDLKTPDRRGARSRVWSAGPTWWWRTSARGPWSSSVSATRPWPPSIRVSFTARSPRSDARDRAPTRPGTRPSCRPSAGS